MKLFATVRSKTILYTVSLIVLLGGGFFGVFQLFLAKILRENVSEPYDRLIGFLASDPYIRERLLEGCPAGPSEPEPSPGASGPRPARSRKLDVDERIQFYEVVTLRKCPERGAAASRDGTVPVDRFQREPEWPAGGAPAAAEALLRRLLAETVSGTPATMTRFEGDLVLRAGPIPLAVPAPGPASATLLGAAEPIQASIRILAYGVIPRLSERIQEKASREDEEVQARIEAVLALYRQLVEADGRVLFALDALPPEKVEPLLRDGAIEPRLGELEAIAGEIATWDPLGVEDLVGEISPEAVERWVDLVGGLLREVSFERPVPGAAAVAISSESLALLRRLRLQLAWISTGVLFVGLVLAGVVSRRVTEPLYRLKEGIDRFATGNLAYRIPCGGEGEVGGLAAELNRMAERMEEAERTRRLAAMGLMMGGAAHELKNPIHALAKGLELLSVYLEEVAGGTGAAVPPDPGRARRIAERIERMKTILSDGTENLGRMAKLVEDILSLARIDVARFERLDLAAIVPKAVEEVRSRGEGEVEVRCEVGPGPIEVLGSGVLKLVFTNLVANAIQSVRERQGREGVGGLVEVRLAVDPVSGARLAIVRDDGSGIRPADRERLFEPFFTTRPVGEGTGLGLFLAHEIVAAHGGRLKGTSEGMGRGATFTVELPRPARAPGAGGAEGEG